MIKAQFDAQHRAQRIADTFDGFKNGYATFEDGTVDDPTAALLTVAYFIRELAFEVSDLHSEIKLQRKEG